MNSEVEDFFSVESAVKYIWAIVTVEWLYQIIINNISYNL